MVRPQLGPPMGQKKVGGGLFNPRSKMNVLLGPGKVYCYTITC